MDGKLHYEIFGKKRKQILPLLKKFRNDFYLAGGTALVLLIGHRKSVDFDFFNAKSFATDKLFQKILAVFKGYKIKKVQEDKNTLTVILDEEIKISFFAYHYPLIENFIETKYFRLASVQDIGCMKLSAMISRPATRDYVDLYFILQQLSLDKLLRDAEKKFPEIDRNLILKSLVYFKDINPLGAVRYVGENKVSFNRIKSFLVDEVKKSFDNLRSKKLKRAHGIQTRRNFKMN